MTSLFFVRHAQPDYRTGNERTFMLSEEGMADRNQAFEVLKEYELDSAVSSPYTRSIMTIQPIIDDRKLYLRTDERLRERKSGTCGNSKRELFKKRWDDFLFHEDGGENLNDTQIRNIEAVNDILKNHAGKNILIGTHGTALSTIINYYDPTFGYDDFMRIIDFMPWVVKMDFSGTDFIEYEELTYVKKELHGVGRK